MKIMKNVSAKSKLPQFFLTIILGIGLTLIIGKKEEFNFFKPLPTYSKSEFEAKAIDRIEGVYGKNSGLKNEVV